MSKVKIQGNASGSGTLTIAAPNTNTDRTLTLPDEGGEVLLNGTSSNVGIGTTVTTGQLNISKSGGNTVNLIDSSGSTPGIRFANSSNTALAFIEAPAGNGLSFFSSSTERMRISSNGDIFIGNTTPMETTNAGGANFWVPGSFNRRILQLGHTDSANRVLAQFFGNSSTTAAGYIACTGVATSYVTSSDYRLKTDVQPMTGATERLKALKPVNFEWISTGERVDGFLAHEAQEVVPEAVTGAKDAVQVWTEGEELPEGVAVGDNKLDEDGNTIPDYQGIDQSKLVPLLVAAMQEQQATIEDLTSRLAALENA